MIPKNVREGAVAQNLTGETRAFTIKANGKAFRTLIDGLYSNKIRAIVRELCSNARDSHIDAGRADMPFIVQVPTPLDPTFRVRDYGTSLSHEDVMYLYTTIFESSKEETNELTGQLGLGSKSPFAYTDSFSLVATLDGEQRTYLAFLATDGVPSITHVSTDTTYDPNGLEVAFAVKRDDCGQFAREMQFVSMGYDPGTILVEGTEITIPTPRLKGNGWAIYYSGAFGNVAGHNFVRQGSAIYPNAIAVPNVATTWITVVDIPIGTAEVTASREALSYDDDTRKEVTAALQRASDEVQTQITEVFAKAKTRIDLAKLYSEYNGVLTNLKGSTKVSLVAAPETLAIHYNYAGLRRPGDVLEKAQHFGKGANARGTHERHVSSLEFNLLASFVLIVNDPDEKMVRRKKRIQNAVAELSNGVVYVLSEADPIDRQEAIAWISQCFELKPEQIIQARDLRDYPPTPAERIARSTGKRRALQPGQFWLPRREGVVYSDYGAVAAANKSFSGALQRALNASGIKVNYSDLFFVTERQQAAHEKRGDLPVSQRLDHAIAAALKARVATLPLDEAQTVQILFDNVGEYNKALPVVLHEFFPNVKMDKQRSDQIIGIAMQAKIDLQSRPIVGKINKEVRDLIDRYPLLFQRSDRSHYEHYVAAVNAA